MVGGQTTTNLANLQRHTLQSPWFLRRYLSLLSSKPQVVVPSFYNIISNDEDTLKIVVQIMNGMSASAAELQKYLSYWDKYKYIWENDKAWHG